MRLATTLLCVMTGLAVMGVAANVHAVAVPAVEIDTYTGGTNYPFSLGWRFTPTRPFRITALGVFDVKADGVQNIGEDIFDPLGGQPVCLFEWGGADPQAGPRLIYTIVPTTNGMDPVPAPEPAGTLGAYYVNIEPFTVTVGKEYLVAAQVMNRDFCYGTTFLNDGNRPFNRSACNGQATAVDHPDMPELANDTGTGYGFGTFPIGPTGIDDYFGATFKYELLPAIPGDANNDQKVNEADAALLAENWGKIGGWAQGDFSEDGVIGAADASILAANWYHGMTTEGGGPGGVPEPGAVALLAAVVLAALALRRGRD